ncbi:MAG: DUF3179 domain-containing protein [Haloglomus sp.]
MRWSRRSLLGCCAGALGALAGCGYRQAAGRDSPAGDGTTPTPTAPPTETPERRMVNGIRVPVPLSELRRGAPKNGIPAIVDPAFAEDWSGFSIEVNTNTGTYVSEPRLESDDRVIGVERDGEARAYPLRVLNWHEIVNDSLGGPLLVTYCPLCGSGLTAVRRAGGEETIFGVSGYLHNQDLVMYDEATGSLWSQIAATAIRGPLTGETLELVPSTLTTWGEWQAVNPETVVLRPPPESTTITDTGPANYTRYPYRNYRENDRIGLGGAFSDDRLHPKTMVVGVSRDGAAVAYPLDAVQEAGVINDVVGGFPVVVAATEAGTLVAYSRRVDGETLTFERAGTDHLRAGGSRWRITTGTAVDGPHQGTTLTKANDASPMFFFAWKKFNPDTAVYGAENTDTADGAEATGTPTG